MNTVIIVLSITLAFGVTASKLVYPVSVKVQCIVCRNVALFGTKTHNCLSFVGALFVCPELSGFIEFERQWQTFVVR